MPWGSAAVALVGGRACGRAFASAASAARSRYNGRRYPIGTAFIRNAENPADLHARLAALAAKHGAELVPIDST